jgi:hypothetical protein
MGNIGPDTPMIERFHPGVWPYISQTMLPSSFEKTS